MVYQTEQGTLRQVCRWPPPHAIPITAAVVAVSAPDSRKMVAARNMVVVGLIALHQLLAIISWQLTGISRDRWNHAVPMLPSVDVLKGCIGVTTVLYHRHHPSGL
jgi:hypothetical protein